MNKSLTKILDLTAGTCLVFICVALLIVSCVPDRHENVVENKKHFFGHDVRKLCIKGVTYYTYKRGITVALDSASKIIPCEKGN